jgi:1-acyl-sn-glycerol-3-phosphate acyltransferase
VIRSALAILWTFAMMPVAALVGFPWTFISGRIDFLYGFAMWIARMGVRIAGVRIEVRGMENLDPAQSYIVMSNHVSNLDPPILIPVLPGRTSVLVKKELFRIPLLGRAMRMANIVAVDRSDREAAIASIHAAADVLRREHIHMTVFPEGTRSLDGKLLPFKKGPFHLALETGLPIVPVTIAGTRQMMPKGALRIRPGTATVTFHAPIASQQVDREILMEAVRRSIEAAPSAI